ncbi:MAG: hypothetical protein IJC15_03050 [Clostridia bacterium]|nr:hypothetical protein [Clostridia bacterium]
MKHCIFLFLAIFICLTACANDSQEAPETTWDYGSEAPYTMPDGRTFPYRLELTGHGNTLIVYTDDETLTYYRLFERIYSSSYPYSYEGYYIDWNASNIG